MPRYPECERCKWAATEKDRLVGACLYMYYTGHSRPITDDGICHVFAEGAVMGRCTILFGKPSRQPTRQALGLARRSQQDSGGET